MPNGPQAASAMLEVNNSYRTKNMEQNHRALSGNHAANTQKSDHGKVIEYPAKPVTVTLSVQDW